MIRKARTVPEALAQAAKIAIPGSALALLLGKMATQGSALGLRGLGVGPAGGYAQKVLSTSPIAYWPLDETSGSNARCMVNPAQDGTYTGVTLANNSTGPFGTPAPYFDGANDHCDIYSAALAAAFNGSEGSAVMWARVANAGVWTDGTHDYVLQLYVDADNAVFMRKTDVNNSLLWRYEAGAVVESRTTAGHSDTDWIHMGITWSKTNDEVRPYKNGVQEGATMDTLGNWAGALSAVNCYIGAWAGLNQWHGWLAHCAVWNRALGAGEIADLANP